MDSNQEIIRTIKLLIHLRGENLTSISRKMGLHYSYLTQTFKHSDRLRINLIRDLAKYLNVYPLDILTGNIVRYVNQKPPTEAEGSR